MLYTMGVDIGSSSATIFTKSVVAGAFFRSGIEMFNVFILIHKTYIQNLC